MEFEILGPVVVRRAGRLIPVRSPRQRTLLATLLVHAGRVVPTDLLVDSLWADTPPRTARNALQVHVSALRRTLATRPDRLRGPPGTRWPRA